MIYLMDVNALIAVGLRRHEFHERVVAWLQAESKATLATCSITELGFVRVMAQPGAYGLGLATALTLLSGLKESGGLSRGFLPDTLGVEHLPAWVKSPGQITDGHSVQLAEAHGAVLATLDEKIPGAFLIPHAATNGG